MHYLAQLMADIERSHPRLGAATAFAQLCAKANKCLLVVAPAGTGKSTISNTVASGARDCLTLGSITLSGLAPFEARLTDFKGVVTIDDVGRIDTTYARTATVTALSDLCYSHQVSKYTYAFTLNITGFHGAAILNIQPVALGAVIASNDWETVIADKTIRYYHLYRPSSPNRLLPPVELSWGIDVSTVDYPSQSGPLWDSLVKIAGVQWGDARVVEHVTDLLRATAAIDGRTKLQKRDYDLLRRLMAPMTVERYLLDKFDLEGGRYFRNNVLAMLVEFASWGDLTVERISRDYHVPPHRVLDILRQLGSAVIMAGPNSELIAPSKRMQQILREAGVRC